MALALQIENKISLGESDYLISTKKLMKFKKKKIMPFKLDIHSKKILWGVSGYNCICYGNGQRTNQWVQCLG